MLKKLFIISLMSISSLGAMLTPVTKNHVRQYKPGAFKDVEGFGIRKNGTVTRVNAYDVDKQLRQLPSAKFNAASKYIVASKMSNGDMRLRLDSRICGGGGGGAAAGWWIGWGGANVLAQVGIGIVSAGSAALATAAGGPGAGALAFKASYYGLNKALAVPIQSACAKAGAAVSLTMAVATGPV